MYRRANLTGVNPLVYYLVGANRTLDVHICVCVYMPKGLQMAVSTWEDARLPCRPFRFDGDIWALVISSCFDSRRLSSFTAGLVNRTSTAVRISFCCFMMLNNELQYYSLMSRFIFIRRTECKLAIPVIYWQCQLNKLCSIIISSLKFGYCSDIVRILFEYFFN